MSLIIGSDYKDHPILSRIPNMVWYILFGGIFDDKSLIDRDKPFDDIIRKDLPKSNEQALVIILAQYPKVEACKLFGFAKDILRLPLKKIFSYSMDFARTDLLDVIKQNVDSSIIYKMFKQHDFSINIDTFKWIYEQFPPDKFPEIICELSYEGVDVAVRKGDIKSLECIIDKIDSPLPKDLIKKAFECAISNERITILDWLLDNHLSDTDLIPMIKNDRYILFSRAAGKGKLESLEWLDKKAPEHLKAMINANSFMAFRMAALNDQLNSLKWLKTKSPEKINNMIKENGYESFRWACNGSPETIRWFLSHPCTRDYAIENWQSLGLKKYLKELPETKNPLMHGFFNSSTHRNERVFQNEMSLKGVYLIN